MKTKKTKALIVALGIVTMSLAIGFVFSIGSKNIDSLRIAAEESVSGSVTWTVESACTSYPDSNGASYAAQTKGGTNIYLYSHYEETLKSDEIFNGTYSGSENYCIKIVDSSDKNPSSPFYFQHITGISIMTANNSESGASFGVYLFSDAEQKTLPSYIPTEPTDPGLSYDFTVSNKTHSIVIAPTTVEVLAIKSVTISYACDPSNNPNKFNLTYTGYYDAEFLDELDYGLLNSSVLPVYGVEGEFIELTVVPISGYSFDSAVLDIEEYEWWDFVYKSSYSFRFIMPSTNLRIGLLIQTN